MKFTNYMALALAMTAFASCSNEDELGATAWENDPSAVHIQASVGHSLLARTNPGATDDSQKAFNNGDQISVKAGTQNSVAYTLNTSANKWEPATAESFLRWEGTKMQFEAFYPTTEGTTMTNFNVPTDQSDATKIAAADYMTFAGEKNRPEGAEVSLPVSLEMERKMARIVVNVHLNAEFQESSAKINNISIKGNSKINGNSTSDLMPFTPCVVGNSDQNNPVYVALVAPTPKSDNKTFVSIEVENQTYNIEGIPQIEAGKSYAYNLYLGQRQIGIQSVTIKDWNTDETIISGDVTPDPAPDPAPETPAPQP